MVRIADLTILADTATDHGRQVFLQHTELNSVGPVTAPDDIIAAIQHRHAQLTVPYLEHDQVIARQILRHRSFSFQEFSQRYAAVQGFELSEVRLQDIRNRQNSIEVGDSDLHSWWFKAQQRIRDDAELVYNMALAKGVAKEQARKLLPEGLTMSKMYMNGTLRSWLHYVDIRCDKATQKEHREVAEKCRDELTKLFPNVMEAFNTNQTN